MSAKLAKTNHILATFILISQSINVQFSRMKSSGRFAHLIILLTVFAVSLSVSAGEVYDALARYAGNIGQFSLVYPQEKVYIQFDNTSYYTGETIWFKAYVVNAADNHRAPSKVLYVDLLSPGGVILKTQKLKVVAGQCDGSFPLLDASTSTARELRGVLPYPSGFYEVRAYTMNMLNFSHDAVFSRVLPVYEKPSEEGGYYNEAPSIKLHNTTVEQYRPELKKPSRIDAGFYPEGGHLIIGKPCRVAFKITGEDAMGIDATGSVDEYGITFQTVHDGMGSFIFTPTSKSCRVTVNAGGHSRHFDLPDAEAEGYAMTVNRAGNNLLVSISGTDGMPADTLGMTLTCRDGLAWFGVVPQKNHEAEIQIPLSSGEGVCRIVLFNRSGDILASRSFYAPSTQQSPHLTFEPDQQKYGPFQEINLDFTLKDGSGAPFRDRFCLSVRDSRTSGNMTSDDLRTSLLLSSDLKGFVANPEWYFESDDELHSEALDLLTMVQGWERYEWRTMSGIDKFQEKHRTEQGLTLNGWVLSPSGDKPITDIKVMAAIVPPEKKQTEQFNCITDSTGYFGLDVSDFYDVARLTIHTTQKRRLIGTSSRILFERSMTPAIRPYHKAETTLRNIISRNKVKKHVEEPADDNLPEVIWDNIGYLLPDVDINERRKYIDYYTFKAFNVQQDIEAELDRAEFSGDILGYLHDKGYTFSVKADSGGIMNTLLQIDGSDEEVALQIADTCLINGIPAFWYVHNNERCQYQGTFCPPWAIDTQDVKSMMIYDRVMPLSSVLDLAPLFVKGLGKHVDVTTTSTMQSAENSHNYYLIDLQVKDDYFLSTKRELSELGKRISTFAGYSSPYQFYSPSYPDGPIIGDVDYRRTLFWEPNVITDADGHARVTFYNNSQTSEFSVTAAGITASGQPYTLDTGF